MDSTVMNDCAGTSGIANPALANLLTAFTPFNGAVSLRPAAAPATSGSSNIPASFLTALYFHGSSYKLTIDRYESGWEAQLDG